MNGWLGVLSDCGMCLEYRRGMVELSCRQSRGEDRMVCFGS